MLLCGMLASSISHAEHHNPFGSTESLYLGEIPVVLSGTRLAQPLNESPVAITVIDREMITASGAREIPDLFRLVPGMLVGSHKGHDRDVGYLGLLDAFSRRMQVLIDGRTAYDPLVGGVNWATLPLDVEDIERIEVIRGPNAASFGTNAFLGTIIITTRHQFDPGRAHATLRTGSDEVLDVHAGFGDDTTPWNYHFTLGHREDDGFDTLHDGKRVNFLSGELARNLDTETRLELKAGYSSGDLEVEDSVGQRTVDTEDGYLMGRWQRDWNVDSGLTLTAYHQWTSWYESDRFTEFLGPFLLATDVVRDIDTSRSDLNLEHRFRLAPDWRGVWGGEARFDSASSAFDLGTTSDLQSDLYRLFGHLEWQVADMAQASLGLMWEESDLMDAELSPRAGLVIHPAAGHTLRLSASHATRSPVIFEAYSDQGVTLDIVSPPPQAGCDAAYAALLGGAATFPAPCQVRSLLNWTRTPLEPEQITSYELGYRYGAGFGQLPGNVSADLKLFRKEIDDVTIGTFTSAPLSSNGLANVSGSAIDYFNAAEVTVDGIEGSIEWRLEPGTRLIGGFSLVNADAQNKLPGIVDDNEIGKIADSFPDYTLMAMLIHRFDGGLTTSLTGHYVDEVEYLGDGEFVKAQTRIDARVGYDLRVDRSRVRLAFTLQNLGNEYTDFDNDNVLDTRVLLSLQVEHP
jgi:iron complex outermembrane receptor protein